MKSQEVYPWRGSSAQVKVTIPKNPNGPLRWCRWIDAGGIVQYCHYGGPWHVHKYSRQTGDIYFKVEIIHFTSSKIALYSACRKQDLAAVIHSISDMQRHEPGIYCTFQTWVCERGRGKIFGLQKNISAIRPHLAWLSRTTTSRGHIFSLGSQLSLSASSHSSPLTASSSVFPRVKSAGTGRGQAAAAWHFHL